MRVRCQVRHGYILMESWELTGFIFGYPVYAELRQHRLFPPAPPRTPVVVDVDNDADSDGDELWDTLSEWSALVHQILVDGTRPSLPGICSKNGFLTNSARTKKNARKNISDMRVLVSLHLLSGLGSFSMSFQHAVTLLLFAPGTCPGSTCSVGGGPTDNQEVADSRASCVEMCACMHSCWRGSCFLVIKHDELLSRWITCTKLSQRWGWFDRHVYQRTTSYNLKSWSVVFCGLFGFTVCRHLFTLRSWNCYKCN